MGKEAAEEGEVIIPSGLSEHREMKLGQEMQKGDVFF